MEKNKDDTPLEDEDADMSPEDRLAWLRERGVLVETSEERKQKQVANILHPPTGDLVYYVHIPADTSQSLQELSYRLPAVKSSTPAVRRDLLLEHLEPAFQQSGSGKSTVDIDLLKEQQQTLLASGGGGTLPVSDATLRTVAKEAHIETFSLVHPTPSNNYTGVTIYLDEVGMLKRLPLNTRASQFAAQAGYSDPPPTFYGDVFMGRTHNTSLQLQDLVGEGNGWLLQAAADNATFQQQSIGTTGGAQNPSVPGSDGKAQEEKEGYTWTQTQEEVEVCIDLPKSVVKSNQVQVISKPQSLRVLGDKALLLQLSLFERVDVDSCTWTLESSNDDGKKLVITLEKAEQAFWPRIRD